MATLTVMKAKANLDRLIDQIAQSHKPVVITSKHSSAVLISEEDWIVIQEMLHSPKVKNTQNPSGF